MSEEQISKIPLRLKIINWIFISLWCLVATFPLVWIVVMSFKIPKDAFAQNFFQVLFGTLTIEEVGGLSFIDIAFFLAVFFWGYRNRHRIRNVVVRQLEKTIGASLSVAVYGISFFPLSIVGLFYVTPFFANLVEMVVSYLPILNLLADPIMGITLQHYYSVWIEKSFYDNFINSLIITFGVVTISLSIGTLAGYGLARSNSNLAFWMLILALIFRALPHSVLVSGYLPAFINSRDFFAPLWEWGTTAWFFNWLADEPPTFYGHPLPVIIVLVAINQPFTIWMLRSFFANIPNELDEAARVDGCTYLQAFKEVIMPVMWPGVITAGLFSFLLAYNDYIVTSLLLDYQSQTMVPAITQFFNRETTATDEVEAVSAAVSIVVPLFFLVMFFQKQIVSGLTQGAVKG